MIAKLIRWSAGNLTLVFIATAFAVVGGLWALKTLPLDAIPDLSDTQVIVYTEFPGQAPQVVKQDAPDGYVGEIRYVVDCARFGKRSAGRRAILRREEQGREVHVTKAGTVVGQESHLYQSLRTINWESQIA